MSTAAPIKTTEFVYDALQDFIDQGLHALAIEIIETPLIDKHS